MGSQKIRKYVKIQEENERKTKKGKFFKTDLGATPPCPFGGKADQPLPGVKSKPAPLGSDIRFLL